MCGFVATYSLRESQPLNAEVVERANGLLKHRGPDDSGVKVVGSAVLASNRLKIIDLSDAGHQPMSNEDGTIWIAYNGEVYNFKELREDLEKKGHLFRSKTDTEVIVHGYEEYGSEIIQRLRGMFAFALYDAKRTALLVARDRLGIKPLYYTQTGETFVCASEIKALLALPVVPRELDASSLREYLTFGKVYAPHTMFRGILKLPAAHYAMIDDSGKMSLTRYWSPYANTALPTDASEDYCASRLRELLEQSVRLRMVSDVPVGVFLSGGVDSTTNVALMSAVTGTRVKTFTAGFHGQESFDERAYARGAARVFHTEHHEVEVRRDDLMALLPELSYYLDEPVADPTVVPIYFVSRLARNEGAIVILNGDGSDELFCGYTRWQRFLTAYPYWRAFNALPQSVRSSTAKAARSVSIGGLLTDLADRSARGVEMYVGATGALKGTDLLYDAVLANGSRDVYAAVREGARRFAIERRSRDYAEWLSYWGLQSEVEHVFLYRADRMGMANSIEIRVPFLDHHIVEFAAQMPQELKHKHGEPKYILKKAVSGLVPENLLKRRKQGFSVPLAAWAGEMMAREAVPPLDQMHKDWGVPDRRTLQQLMTIVQANDNDLQRGMLAWNIYTLAMWYKRWFGK